MDKTEELHNALAKLIADNMGNEASRLFYDFYDGDSYDSMVEGAKALLHSLMGPEMADQKIEKVIKSL